VMTNSVPAGDLVLIEFCGGQSDGTEMVRKT